MWKDWRTSLISLGVQHFPSFFLSPWKTLACDFRLSLLQSGSRTTRGFRAANGCRDNQSRPFSLRRPTFRGRGRCSLVLSWLLLLRDAERGATIVERKSWSRTWNRREIFTSHPIRGAASHSPLCAARKECGKLWIPPRRAIVVAGESGL